MLAFVSVRLPTVVVAEPSVMVALPSVAVLFARKVLGNATATDVILALANVPLVNATLLIVPPVMVTLALVKLPDSVAVTVPPVIATALAFCVAIVPRPVTLATGTLARLIVTLLVSAPPPDNKPPASTLMVFATAPDTFATGMVVEAVTPAVLLLYMYPVRVVTVRPEITLVSPPSIFCQTEPLKQARSPTPQSV